ncbi:family 78 glycoside hydrolase catalytic domain (plasmid) [Streptomyces sp. NBC_00841]|uniref:family 78 glycoside hydrolase catalytic domain n=1 Tax=unclassified Streptomyces TaxID=2593676 RepID=UPI002250B31B|nr:MULTISPECIES: family 78 glycoside hydrolase catalytic domain [unclassified Streptomyces]MCX4538928.1 family 78 glycoside hydrolase catalytic domain [Streptomyces sp. NBC_01669]WSA04840.1 family 78 glycoside hydrolase catalytic domain [Streptomyces sp. NBC_00841]
MTPARPVAALPVPPATPVGRRFFALLAALVMVTVAFLVADPAAGATKGNGLAVGALQTNARTDPLGIAGNAPTFSWKSTSGARGVVQSAYEVRVGTSAAADDVWSSGKVESSDQLDVRYAGPDLASQTRYYWQARVWDGDDQAGDWSAPSWFETGILDAAEWTGDWIGKSAGGEMDKWTDYTTDVDFTLDNLALGVYLRASDTGNAYMWQVSTADGTAVPKFRPHKKVNGGYSLLGNIPITTLTSAQLLTGTHRLSITVDGPTITTRLDGAEIDSRTDATFAKGFIGFRQDLANEGPETAHIHAVKVTSKAGDVLFRTDFSGPTDPFTGGTLTPDGLLVEKKLDAILRTSDSNLPLLRKEFTTDPDKTVARARVYASAHGTYELELNGKKVGDQFLAPGDTDYRKRIQYQTYDVTDQLANGRNAIGAELGDGWWAGKVGMWGPGVFGNSVGLIAQVRIDYTDGTHQVIKTDGTWKSHSGPYVAADNIDGETYDAGAEQPGWDRPAYDDAAWNPATVGASDTAKLVPQPDEPVRATGELPALTRTSPSAGTYVYDLGQNMVGVARMRLQGVTGQTVKIRYGEVLNKDGSLYTANLRAAKVTDYYTFSTSGTVVYEPKFTQHGYRYLEISNVTSAPELGDVTGVVWGSDLKATGTLTTSNAMLNQLQSNISWGQRGNFLSIPTDTPARDERLGWTGDINVFSPTASYLRDTRAFLGKWTTDLRDSAYSNGNYPGIAPSVPTIDMGSGLGWSDSAVTVPYAVWHAQGDNAIVRANYASMKKFLGFVKNGAGDDLIDSARGNWNDWLNLDDNTGTDVLGTAYYAEDARMLSEMAKAIGEDADSATYAKLSADVRDAFTSKLVAADGTVQGGSQTAYAMALGMNLVTDPALREKVGEKFVAKLKTSDYHLTTGFLGTPWLLPALSSIGRSDLAYTMILKKDYPSWGYEIEHGATTMWERWNSINPDGSFGDVSMNSFNHYAYGAVGDWMYQNIGGISAIKAGYKESKIAPAMGGDLTSGHGTYESVYGTIGSNWKKTDQGMSLDITVPVNTTSRVSIPARNIEAVTEGGTPITKADGVSDVSVGKGVVTFTVGSGSYSIHSDTKRALFGDIVSEIHKTDDHAGDLATAGDLGAASRTHIGGALDTASGKVEDALAADVAGDSGQASQRLSDGVATIRTLKTWLADSSVDGPVKNDLTTRLESIEALFGKAVAASLGISVVVPPVADPGLPGASVPGTIGIANAGDVGISDLKAVVTVDDWNVDPTSSTKDTVGAGDSAQLPFTVSVPKHQKPGTYDASVKLTFTSQYGTFTLNDSTPWVSVTSGVDITTVTSANPVDGSDEKATLTATVKNNSRSAVSGQVTAVLPEGWKTPPASDRVTIEPGATKVVVLPLFPGLETVAGDQDAEVDFVDEGAMLASKNATIRVNLAVPPTQDVLDYVDFGNAASENAHAIMAAPASGTNIEAGLDRRYANSANPGSWYSAVVHVTPGKPFMLRNRETFDGARTKKYNIYVDDTLVKTYMLKRTETGMGTKTYQTVIDDPAAIDNDGTVRIKYEFPLDASGYFDPSIADSWVLPVSDDSLAPLASATVTSAAAPGDNGWYRGDASVAVTAVDNRDTAPSVEVGQSAGWQAYVAPVMVSGDGKHSVYYRAKDTAGNSTGQRTAQIWIDGTAPVTQLAVTRGPGTAEADRAMVGFTAQDTLSGVATTTYRIDGSAWKVLAGETPAVEGFGRHTVDFFSTDVAGNPEPVHSVAVDLADVDTIKALVAPQIAGTPKYGSVLTATTGSWNTKGLSFAYQWRRDGHPIGAANASTYRLVRADMGHRLSVTVTASKAGKAPASSTSAETARVTAAKSQVVVGLSATSVKKKQSVTLTVTVSTTAGTPGGSVLVYENGHRVKTLTLSAGGTASTALTMNQRGLRTLKVVYAGDASVEGSSSQVHVRVL